MCILECVGLTSIDVGLALVRYSAILPIFTRATLCDSAGTSYGPVSVCVCYKSVHYENIRLLFVMAASFDLCYTSL